MTVYDGPVGMSCYTFSYTATQHDRGAFSSRKSARGDLNMKALAVGSTGSKASRKQRKSSYATPGAKGRLLPGEKARLKRARVDAKRAARSEGQGFNAKSVVREIESFVQAAGDMKVSLYAALLDRLTLVAQRSSSLGKRETCSNMGRQAWQL